MNIFSRLFIRSRLGRKMAGPELEKNEPFSRRARGMAARSPLLHAGSNRAENMFNLSLGSDGSKLEGEVLSHIGRVANQSIHGYII